jgi:hypothetical protein
MTTRTATVGLWTPTTETVEQIGNVLCAHWATATAAAKSPFWRKPASWLDPPRHHLTTGGRLMRYASGSASVPNPNRVPRS